MFSFLKAWAFELIFLILFVGVAGAKYYYDIDKKNDTIRDLNNTVFAVKEELSECESKQSEYELSQIINDALYDENFTEYDEQVVIEEPKEDIEKDNKTKEDILNENLKNIINSNYSVTF